MQEIENRPTAVLFAVESANSEHSIAELSALCEAAEIDVVGIVVQKLAKGPFDATYLGSGKVQELKEIAAQAGADMAICDDELTGVQARNLEEAVGCAVIDRTVVILDIFAARASSKEGKLQVEMAQLAYRLPRLAGIGASLSRLGGGIGTRGPGEKKLETDRRHIQRRMDAIRLQLKEAAKDRSQMAKQRKKGEVKSVCLVGYTNAGKSALMNALLRLCQAEGAPTLEKDMLFATLDPSRRKITLPSGRSFVLIDTVGFVSKLPHTLIEAFRSTLDEVKDSELLVHVVDSSYEGHAFQEKTVYETLASIGAGELPVIEAYNKIDLLNSFDRAAAQRGKRFGVSATAGTNVDKLLSAIEAALFPAVSLTQLLIPYSQMAITSRLAENVQIEAREYTSAGTLLSCWLDESERARYRRFLYRPD